MSAVPLVERLRDAARSHPQASSYGTMLDAAEALTELYEALDWCVSHPDECLGDYPKQLLAFRVTLVKARGEQ